MQIPHDRFPEGEVDLHTFMIHNKFTVFDEQAGPDTTVILAHAGVRDDDLAVKPHSYSVEAGCVPNDNMINVVIVEEGLKGLKYRLCFIFNEASVPGGPSSNKIGAISLESLSALRTARLISSIFISSA